MSEWLVTRLTGAKAILGVYLKFSDPKKRNTDTKLRSRDYSFDKPNQSASSIGESEIHFAVVYIAL